MTNPFEDIATKASRPMQKKLQRQAKQPMVPTAMEKKQYDKAKQLLLFKKWKREIRQGLIDGDYGSEIVQLLKLLRRTPDSDVLVRYVQNSKWLIEADKKVRSTILSWIADAIMRWDIRHGRPPFNDSLPWEPDTPFVAIRKILVWEER